MASLAELQPEILHSVLMFLTNDAPSIGKLSLTCQSLHRRINGDNNNDVDSNGEVGNHNDDIWKEMVDRQWSAPDPPTVAVEPELYYASMLRPYERYRDLFLRRSRLDHTSLSSLQFLAIVLQRDLGLVVGNTTVPPNHTMINNNWTTSDGIHDMVQSFGINVYDSFKAVAYRIYLKCWCHCEGDDDEADANNKLSIHDKTRGYLAALYVQHFHYTHFLKKWIRLSAPSLETESQPPSNHNNSEHEEKEEAEEAGADQEGSTQDDNLQQQQQLEASRVLEESAFAICEMQRTPLEVIHEERFQHTVQQAKATLDEMAGMVKGRLEGSFKSTSIQSKMKEISNVIVNRYGFTGNTEDYYNYKNSLLDRVIQTKKGIPLTLCVVYICVCRRLEIPVQIIGLPGHVVLGFDNDLGSRSYMDAFHGGTILSVENCRAIVSHYPVPWDDSYLDPLRNYSIMQRVLNNLMNCHSRTEAEGSRFHEELVQQQRLFGHFHHDPPLDPSHALPMASSLPIFLQCDLLRAYKLMAEVDGRTKYGRNTW